MPIRNKSKCRISTGIEFSWHFKVLIDQNSESSITVFQSIKLQKSMLHDKIFFIAHLTDIWYNIQIIMVM